MRVLGCLMFLLLLSPISGAQVVTPLSCYEQGLHVTDMLKQIREARGIASPIEASFRDSSRTPSDVYRLSRELLIKVTLLAKDNGLDANAVVVPPPPQTRKVPEDSYRLLLLVSDLLKDIATRYGIVEGDHHTQVLPRKTPPDVYREIEKAHRLIDSLL